MPWPMTALHPARRVRLGAVAALALSAIVLASLLDERADATSSPGSGSTLTGSYLAARHAKAEGDDSDAASFLLAALDKAPDDQVLLGRAFLALTLDGRVAEAVDIARRYLDRDGTAALAHIVVAVGELHDGHPQKASAQLQAAPQSPLTSFLVPLLQAWAEYGAGHREAAMAALDRLRATPAMGTLYEAHAAWLLDAEGDGEAALAHARAAIKGEEEPWLRLAELAGSLLQRTGHKDEAEALYRSYLQRRPDSHLLDPALAQLRSGKAPQRGITTARDGAAEALFDAAGIASRQNNRETALALSQLGLFLRPDFPALQVLAGDMLDDAERYEAANRIYESINTSSPLAVAARLGVARNLDRLDHFDQAASMLRQMAKDHPDDAEPLSELGDMLRRRERFAEAVIAYDEAVARIGTLQPRHWRLLYARGIALERSKQWPRAEADLLKALEFEPDQPFVLNYLGYSWVEQGNNLEKAQAMIRKAVELQPNDGYIIDSLGWVLFRLGQHEEAVTQLERAVELRPEDAAINDHLGDAYWAAGRQREARYQWTAALASDPEPELKAAIEKKQAQGPASSPGPAAGPAATDGR